LKGRTKVGRCTNTGLKGISCTPDKIPSFPAGARIFHGEGPHTIVRVGKLFQTIATGKKREKREEGG